MVQTITQVGPVVLVVVVAHVMQAGVVLEH
jgi:hypothetical protein